MSFVNTVPLEVLSDIISRLSYDVKNLWSCSLVSKRFWETATPKLYQYVDLRADERGEEDLHEMCLQRQRILLTSIAENPILGAMVRNFENHPSDTRAFQDATKMPDSDAAIFTKAAANMKNLSSAFLTSNPVTDYIIGHLPEYSALSNLTIKGLYPEEHLWPIRPTQLTTLKWEVPGVWAGGDNLMNPWDEVTLLEKVVQLTCPHLNSLDISVIRHENGLGPELGNQAREYLSLEAATIPKLRNFQFSNQTYGGDGPHEGDFKKNYIDFVGRYRDTLQSLTIPISQGWDTDTLRFILSLCNLVPAIKSISLDFGYISGQENLTAIEFWKRLTTALASPKFEIERLSIMDIGTHFSEDIGMLLAKWKNLKYLKIGDASNNDGNFGDDGRLDFDGYKSELIKFFSALPKSVEEVYLEINGDDLCVDENSDFDPMHQLAPDIFNVLPRLHTCDIHAWISNIDGGTGLLPEKAVLYRRFPGQNAGQKSISIMRMDSVYQEERLEVCNQKELLHGDFEGRDTNDTLVEWVREYKLDEAQNSLGEISNVEQDYSWPFSKDSISRYSMFKERYY